MASSETHFPRLASLSRVLGHAASWADTSVILSNEIKALFGAKMVTISSLPDEDPAEQASSSVRATADIQTEITVENQVVGRISIELGRTAGDIEQWLARFISYLSGEAVQRVRATERHRKDFEDCLAQTYPDPDMRKMAMSAMVHELRSPLLALRMGCDMLRRDLQDAEQLELIRHMQNAHRRLQQVVENLVVFERSNFGLLSISDDRVELEPIIEEVVSAFEQEADSENIAIAVHGIHDLAVSGDPERLLHVMKNIVGNAVKFSPKGAAVTIEVSKHDKEVRVEVSDAGPGIHPEIQRLLQIPFASAAFSVPGTHKKGIGLGLYVARLLTECMGGELEASANEQAGAKVSIRLRAA